MAWEWVSSVSTATVGVVAILGTNWAANRGRRHEREMAEERHSHERLTTHEQWIRDHRKDTYISLLDHAEAVGLFVQRIHPMMDTNPPRPEPELPGDEQQQHVRARVIAFGSEAVKGRMKEWHTLVQRAIRAAGGVSHGIEGARQQLHDLRGEERKARESMGQQIADELQSTAPELASRRAAPDGAGLEATARRGRLWRRIRSR